MYDVICVGGGVAGSVTASLLARNRHRVLILERTRFPHDKACGEGILPHGVRGLERLGVPLSPVTRIRGIRFRVGAESALLPFSSGHGLAVRRYHLDQALLSHARDVGVEVRRSAVRRVEPSRVFTDRGPLETRFVVGADGVHSMLHRAFGCQVRSSSTRIGFSTHFSNLDPDPDLVEVVCFSKGEVYIAPVEPGLTLVSLLVDRKLNLQRGDVPMFLRHLLPGRFQDTSPATPILGATPVSQTVDRVSGDRWLLVGDSAGCADPIGGQGISMAILGGELAAQVLDAALKEDAPLSIYAQRLRRLKEPGEKLTKLLYLMARRPRIVEWLFRRQGDLSPFMRMATGEQPFTGLGVLSPFVSSLWKEAHS